MNFSVHTLGCKLNQLETEAITDSFCRRGFSLVPLSSGEASIIIINSCTVTSMAEQKARRIIRKALKDQPKACLLITGCYAQLDKAAITSLEEKPGQIFVIPGDKKNRILDLPKFLAQKTAAEPGASLQELLTFWLEKENKKTASDGSFKFKPVDFSFHSRAFLKIQDGCDRRCTYCRVSIARGKSRSLEAEKALIELQKLEQQGFNEVVLTGVNISQYLSCNMALPGLLDFLLKETSNIRIRLSSIEPFGLTDDFFKAVQSPRIRPHFHFSLQSASSRILEKMDRNYSAADIKKAAALLRSIRNDPFLACDIIAGFPGETKRDFEETYDFCRQTDFAWIHAFPFSSRPGTEAHSFSGKISQKDISARVQLLVTLAEKGRKEYINRWKGKTLEAVVEGTGNREFSNAVSSAWGMGVPAVSENYLKLRVICGKEAIPAAGSLVQCRVLHKADGLSDAVAEIEKKAYNGN